MFRPPPLLLSRGFAVGKTEGALAGQRSFGFHLRRGGLVFKAHRWLYHSTLGSRVIKKKKKTCAARRIAGAPTRNMCPAFEELHQALLPRVDVCWGNVTISEENYPIVVQTCCMQPAPCSLGGDASHLVISHTLSRTLSLSHTHTLSLSVAPSGTPSHTLAPAPSAQTTRAMLSPTLAAPSPTIRTCKNNCLAEM